MSTYDRMQQLRLWASAPDERLLIIDIDERSLADMAKEFGRWPWPRDTLATVLDHAQSEGAAALVFDILFSDPDRLRPGGDHALATAVQASHIGLYPVARLPAHLDAQSALRVNQLPGLALPSVKPATTAPTLAAILPFMQTMLASGRLGTNTVQRDADGKLRRFALVEPLQGGWQLRSMPAAVAALLSQPVDDSGALRPVVWRQQVDAYPRVPFSVAWACAEGHRQQGCPALRGRIVIMGSSATSLHDVQATPLSNQHAAVDVLATLVDNALHQRYYREVPPSWGFVFAVGALAMAWSLTRRGSAGATRKALIGLPLLLLTMAYASLHSEAIYLDLMLPAGLVLTYLSGLAAFDTFRCWWLGAAAGQCVGPIAVVMGAHSTAAEHLERAVFDLATRDGLRVSGGRALAGDGARLHSLWVLWGLADGAAGDKASQALAAAVPGAWARPFEVGAEPQRDLLRAMARGTAGIEDSPATAAEVVNAT